MGRGAYFFRGFPWVAVTVALWMVVAALLLLNLSGRVVSRGGLSALIWVAFGAALIASYTLVLRAAIRRTARQFEFRLDGTSLSRQMRGYPVLRIELAAVAAVRDDPGFLTATAGDPPKRMVIPKGAAGYDAIREALAARCARVPAAPMETGGAGRGGGRLLDPRRLFFPFGGGHRRRCHGARAARGWLVAAHGGGAAHAAAPLGGMDVARRGLARGAGADRLLPRPLLIGRGGLWGKIGGPVAVRLASTLSGQSRVRGARAPFPSPREAGPAPCLLRRGEVLQAVSDFAPG